MLHDVDASQCRDIFEEAAEIVLGVAGGYVFGHFSYFSQNSEQSNKRGRLTAASNCPLWELWYPAWILHAGNLVIDGRGHYHRCDHARRHRRENVIPVDHAPFISLRRSS